MILCINSSKQNATPQSFFGGPQVEILLKQSRRRIDVFCLSLLGGWQPKDWLLVQKQARLQPPFALPWGGWSCRGVVLRTNDSPFFPLVQWKMGYFHDETLCLLEHNSTHFPRKRDSESIRTIDTIRWNHESPGFQSLCLDFVDDW